MAENEVKLPELPEPVSAMSLAAWGPKPDYYTADQLRAYATEAVRMNQAAGGGSALGWRVRERRASDGKLLDCFIEAPPVEEMAYGLEVLGDDYTGYGDIEGKLAHCKMIVAWANATPPAAQVQQDDEYLAALDDLYKHCGYDNNHWLYQLFLKFVNTARPAADALGAVSEVAREIHYLMRRASRDGHEVGQRLASEVKAKLEAALESALGQGKANVG